MYLFDLDANENLLSSDTAVLPKFNRLYSLEIYDFVVSNAIYRSFYKISWQSRKDISSSSKKISW